MNDHPEVSVIIPAYRSEQTVESCLAALQAQTCRDFETILVDSSPADKLAPLLAERFPGIRYIHHPARLLPHAARNLAAGQARGELLVFTDPDIVPEPGWLEQLVAAHLRTGGAVCGAVACHGRRWLHRGIHLCKFQLCLPGAPAGPARVVMTGNLLCPAGLFRQLDGFTGHIWAGDTLFGQEIRSRGLEVWFTPAAGVRHIHEGTMAMFCRSRFLRGKEMAFFRAAGKFGSPPWGRTRLVSMALASLLPVRLLKSVLTTAINGIRAGFTRDVITTWPVYIPGFAFWLWGETAGYLGLVWKKPATPVTDASLRL